MTPRRFRLPSDMSMEEFLFVALSATMVLPVDISKTYVPDQKTHIVSHWQEEHVCLLVNQTTDFETVYDALNGFLGSLDFNFNLSVEDHKYCIEGELYVDDETTHYLIAYFNPPKEDGTVVLNVICHGPFYVDQVA